MNPFSAISWLWKGLRGHSITFSLLFAFGLIGLSLTRGLVHLLGELGVPWLGLIVLPIVITGYLAKRERQWVPEEKIRKRWARGLIFGSIGISLLIGAATRAIDRFREERRSPAADTAPARPPAKGPARPHGPPGK